MKWLKLFDIGIQVMITIVAIVCWDEWGFLIFYFGVGGWQVVSCFIHFVVYDNLERNRQRRSYENLLMWVLAVAAVSGGAGWLGNMNLGYAILWIEGGVLIPLGAAMAIAYSINCIYETERLFNGEKMITESIHPQKDLD